MPVRLLEEFDCTGHLFRGTELLGRVSCHFDVYGEYLHRGPKREVLCAQKVLGQILESSLGDYRDVLGEELSLHLDDGRRIDLYIKDVHGLIATRDSFYRP